jgi:hypothetical protein
VSLGIVQPLLFLLPLLFPDGRPRPRWRPVVWVAAIAGLVQMVCTALSDANFPGLQDR